MIHGRSIYFLRRVLFGTAIPIDQAAEHKLGKRLALAVFSSDALSSVAYATGEILTVLVLAGASGLMLSPHIALMIAILIVIVGTSYKQAIAAYPSNGGSYIVSRENFGKRVGLVAACALMIDYVLTVAVSVSAGTLAIVSAFPILIPHTVLISVIAVILIMWINLRGIRESGVIFAFPTYAFIGFVLVLIGIGAARFIFGDLPPVHYSTHADLVLPSEGAAVTITLILRAFSSGCSAMTGIEAVSNGISAFKEPASRNASVVLTWLIILLVIMFGGITFLAVALHILPIHHESVTSQIAHQILGNGLFYYGFQAVTCLILLVAANTSFAGFPNLMAQVSQDGFLPKPLQNIGDRQAFHNGIILLAVLASALIIIFDANVNHLIPLYSLGVFIAFTLCQAGLVKVWIRRRREAHRWWLKAGINAIGCLCTFTVVLVVIESKFFSGAWIAVVALPIMFYVCLKIQHYYTRLQTELDKSIQVALAEIEIHNTDLPKVLVPVGKLHQGTIRAIQFAHSLTDEVIAVTVATPQQPKADLQAQWEHYGMPAKLIVLEAKSQSIVVPLLRLIRKMDQRDPKQVLTTIVASKILPAKWWQRLLHNHQLTMLKLALNAISMTNNKGKTRIFIEVPYQLSL